MRCSLHCGNLYKIFYSLKLLDFLSCYISKACVTIAIFKNQNLGQDMSNREKYVNCFVNALEVDPSKVEDLEYLGVESWDSVGHMSLVAEIESAFDIMMDTDDIIDFSSFKKGIEILKKYDVEI